MGSERYGHRRPHFRRPRRHERSDRRRMSLAWIHPRRSGRDMTLLLNPRATVAITAALRALNTRTVGGVGFATAVAAIALTGAQHPLDDALATHPSLMSSIARGPLDALVASYAAPIVATIAATA